MHGYCGLSCGECPAFNGNHQNDAVKQAAIAAKWSSEQRSFLPEEIVCDGCRTLDNERVFIHCRECDIRRNGLRQERANYAHVIIHKDRYRK